MRFERYTLSRIGWLAAGILTCILAFWAMIWSIAEGLHSKAVALLYEDLEASVSQERWNQGWARLAKARVWNPLNAEYPYYQAYFSHQRAQEEATEQSRKQSDFASLSIAYFYQALRLRPPWGYVWAQLAEAKWKSGDVSEEMFIALDKALIFAPREPFVLHIALRIGFSFWDRLEEGLRDKLLSAVRYLLRHDTQFVIEMALLYRWAEKLRPLLSDDQDIEYLNNRLANRHSAPPAQ